MPVSPRTIATLATGALLVPVVALALPAHAAGEATPPPPQSVTAFCERAQSDGRFTDVSGNTFEDEIECIAAAAITQGGAGGRPADQYAPELEVPRDAMASFIARVIDKADELDTGESIRSLPGYDGEQGFTDVAGNPHAESIDRLAEAGIVRGGPGGRPADQYGPDLPVSRAQLATFLVNALEYMTGDAFSTPEDYFTDDEDAVPHQPRINAVAAEGIGVGDGADTYRPFAPVRRDQMAGFLARTLAVLAADGDIRSLS